MTMKGIIIKHLYLLAFILAAGSAMAGDEPAAAKRVAMSQITAAPATFHGQRIRLQGFLVSEGKGDILYPSEEAMNGRRSMDGVWVPVYLTPGQKPDLNQQKLYYAQLQKHLGHQVFVEGVFDASNSGNLACCSGTLRDVSTVESIVRATSRTRMQERAPPLPIRRAQGRIELFSSENYSSRPFLFPMTSVPPTGPASAVPRVLTELICNES